MALRDQPYLPLYIQDFMTDEKLNECSAKACGVYIRIMCLMHKSEEYGKILLRQKDKQTDKQIKNFAIKCDKHLPYGVEEIQQAITELLSEGVLFIEGDYLCQKRMIKDNKISELRSKAGAKGATKKNDFANAKHSANTKAKDEANSEYEYEIVNENEIEVENTIEVRRQKFYEDVGLRFSDKYTKEMLLRFCDYWTEHNDGGKKMKFEMQKVFNVAMRLSTWNNNNKTFKNGKSSSINPEEVIANLRRGNEYHAGNRSGN